MFSKELNDLIEKDTEYIALNDKEITGKIVCPECNLKFQYIKERSISDIE